MHNKSNVLLPTWIFERAQDTNERNQLIDKYMQRYPGYIILEVKGRFAICEIPR